MKKQQNPIDHHYLPIFYLKKWSQDSGKEKKHKDKIIEYSKPRNVIVDKWKYPSMTGFEKNLYTHKNFNEEDKYIIETKSMKKVDDDASNIIKNLINGCVPIKNSDERLIWSKFILNLLNRNPQRIKSIIKAYDFVDCETNKIISENYSFFQKKNGNQTYDQFINDYNLEFFSSEFRRFIESTWEEKKFISHIMRMYWDVIETDDFPFLTSDRPFYGSGGFAHKSGEPRLYSYFCLALSPEKLFIAASSGLVLKYMSNKNYKISKKYNTQIVRQCKKYVYSSNICQDRFVKNNFSKGQCGNLGIPDTLSNNLDFDNFKKKFNKAKKEYYENFNLPYMES
jgi:hypothetical protein